MHSAHKCAHTHPCITSPPPSACPCPAPPASTRGAHRAQLCTQELSLNLDATQRMPLPAPRAWMTGAQCAQVCTYAPLHYVTASQRMPLPSAASIDERCEPHTQTCPDCSARGCLASPDVCPAPHPGASSAAPHTWHTLMRFGWAPCVLVLLPRNQPYCARFQDGATATCLLCWVVQPLCGPAGHLPGGRAGARAQQQRQQRGGAVAQHEPAQLRGHPRARGARRGRPPALVRGALTEQAAITSLMSTALRPFCSASIQTAHGSTAHPTLRQFQPSWKIS